MEYQLLNNKDIIKDIGLCLKQALINTNLTQKELALRSGINAQSISNLEKASKTLF